MVYDSGSDRICLTRRGAECESQKTTDTGSEHGWRRLAAGELVLLPEFRGREAELLFKRPVKTGVIVKSKLIDQLVEWNPRQDSIFACLEAFFNDILMEGDAHIILKNVGNMVFTHIKEGGQLIQG